MPTSTAPAPAASEVPGSLPSSSLILLKEPSALQFEVAQRYFSDILNAQLVIFSVIVAVLVAISYAISYKASREKIKNSVADEVQKLKDGMQKEIASKVREFQEEIKSSIADQNSETTFLRGQVNQTLAQFHESQSHFVTAFLWWVRAAERYCFLNDDKRTRFCLSKARASVEQVRNGLSLTSEAIGEFQDLLKKITSEKYRIEKELLEKGLKEAIERR